MSGAALSSICHLGLRRMEPVNHVMPRDSTIAPWIVAARWHAARAALYKVMCHDERVVECVLEWAFCDQAPGVWCVQRATTLNMYCSLWPAHARGLRHTTVARAPAERDSVWLYGVDSGPYGAYVQRRLLLARTPAEVVSYAWMACAETGAERSHREAALDQESIVEGFGAGVLPTVGRDRGRKLKQRRKARVSQKHPGIVEPESEAGRWFAHPERIWSRFWQDAGIGRLIHDVYTTPDGCLGCRDDSVPHLPGWTGLSM